MSIDVKRPGICPVFFIWNKTRHMVSYRDKMRHLSQTVSRYQHKRLILRASKGWHISCIDYREP